MLFHQAVMLDQRHLHLLSFDQLFGTFSLLLALSSCIDDGGCGVEEVDWLFTRQEFHLCTIHAVVRRMRQSRVVDFAADAPVAVVRLIIGVLTIDG